MSMLLPVNMLVREKFSCPCVITCFIELKSKNSPDKWKSWLNATEISFGRDCFDHINMLFQWTTTSNDFCTQLLYKNIAFQS